VKINHHLDEATLVSYVAGSLSQGMALVVASHISLCTACQLRVSAMEEIGGALLEQVTCSEMGDDKLGQALTLLENSPVGSTHGVVVNGADKKAIQAEADVPIPLRDYIGESLDSIKWRYLAPGFHYVDVLTGDTSVCRLLKVSPGKSIWPHTHRGNELTQLLRGEYADELGHFTRGDISDLDEQTEHQPLVGGHEDCICLVALDSPLKFTTLLGRLLQPLSGF
jgi:putative transcriptional regulator